ncbi:MAG: hypothetical protein JXB34_14615 [Bacteroidales bacterium]|nr:hypothetical protein [Bacteroidales bacterium]
MIRLFAPLVNILLALVLKISLQGDVSVLVEAPSEVVAGNEFEVKLTINKGDLESFSRLLQNLPAGLTASPITTSNADFNFEDKRARFIWLRLPENPTFTVSYTIKVDPRLKGTFNINGKFSYIAENERRSVDVSSNPVIILPSPDIDPSLIVDIADYERMVVPYVAPATASPQIACVRQQPQLLPDGSGYIVNLLVSKERKEKFAKIEETVPNGYKAEIIKEGDAIFTYKNHTAKYLWMNLPATSFFIVSYKLLPENGSKPLPPLKGKFSYLEADKTISIDIRQTSQDIAQVKTHDDLNNLLANIASEHLVETPIAKADITEKEIKTDVPVKEKIIKPRVNNKFLLEPEHGIYYRVQLAAGHDPVNVKRYFRKYKLDKEVRVEIHEGWNKYSIGSFTEYKEARDYRVHIWNTTVIGDAFVAAYNDGVRITVQEALMVANQKWYQ